MSDLVLSRDRRGARWIPAPADTAWFNPRTTWTVGDTLALYHEIYGLREDEPYHARLALRRGRKTVLQLGWKGDGQPVTRVTQTLSLARVPPGSYTLELEITDAAGKKARSSTPLRLTAEASR